MQSCRDSFVKMLFHKLQWKGILSASVLALLKSEKWGFHFSVPSLYKQVMDGSTFEAMH